MNINKIILDTDEKILLQVRKHWFILAVQIFGMVLLATLPYFVYVAIVSSPVLFSLYTSNVQPGIPIALLSAWLLIIWMILFNIWNNYYLDVWTITNRRLIVVDQKGFFFRTTASFRFERLQDIEISVQGLLATLLNYGSLEIQTAGAELNFRATGLPDPGALKALILKSADDLARNRRGYESDGL